MNTNPAAIEIKNLKKEYDGLEALKGVNITIPKGEFHGLLGPNGAGKTTTINILTGLVFKGSGITKVFGKDTVKDFRYTRSKIGIAAQELSVDWFFSIERLLYFQAGYYGIKPKNAKTNIEMLLKRLGLEKKKDSKLRQLSGGMKRRFQLAKALVHDPDIIILDEPTAGVDVELRKDLWEYLKVLHKRGKTILLTTHYIEEAELLCDKISIIDQGKILKQGTPKELIKELGKSGITIQINKTPKNLKTLFSDISFSTSNNRIHFTTKHPEEKMPEIINKLSKLDLKIQNVTLDSSSLEDVFLDLTGKSIND